MPDRAPTSDADRLLHEIGPAPLLRAVLAAAREGDRDAIKALTHVKTRRTIDELRQRLKKGD